MLYAALRFLDHVQGQQTDIENGIQHLPVLVCGIGRDDDLQLPVSVLQDVNGFIKMGTVIVFFPIDLAPFSVRIAHFAVRRGRRISVALLIPSVIRILHIRDKFVGVIKAFALDEGGFADERGNNIRCKQNDGERNRKYDADPPEKLAFSPRPVNRLLVKPHDRFADERREYEDLIYAERKKKCDGSEQKAEQQPRAKRKSVVAMISKKRDRQAERKGQKHREKDLDRAEHHIRVRFSDLLGVLRFFLVNKQAEAHGKAELTYRSRHEEYACQAEAEKPL